MKAIITISFILFQSYSFAAAGDSPHHGFPGDPQVGSGKGEANSPYIESTKIVSSGNRTIIVKPGNRTFQCAESESDRDCLKRQGVTKELIEKPEHKYTQCNEWLKHTFPDDQQFKINSEGKIVKGEKADQLFDQEAHKDLTMIGITKRVQKKETYNLDINIYKKEDGSYLIARSERLVGLPGVNLSSDNQKQPLIQQRFSYAQSMVFLNGNPYQNFYSNRASNKELRFSRIKLKMGANGNCFVSNVDNDDGVAGVKSSSDTELCHKFENFSDKYPNINQCGDPKIFKELNNLLDKYITDTPASFNSTTTIAPNTAAKKIRDGVYTAATLTQQMDKRRSECRSHNLQHFVKNSKLFNADGRTISRKTTKKSSAIPNP